MDEEQPKIPWKDIHQLASDQYARISRGNLWYDTALKTEATTMAATRLLQAMVHYRHHMIDQPEFLIRLYKYFAVIRDETEIARIEWLSQHVQITPPDPISIDCVKIATKELDYINERWATWAYRDGENVYLIELDNNITEYYADLPIGPRVISDPTHKITWGKYGKLGLAVGAIISFDAKYLWWLHHNVEKFKLSERLLADVQREMNKGAQNEPY